MSEIAKLQVITQDVPGLPHALQAERACRGGARWIQFRMKDADQVNLLQAASEVQEVCRSFGAALIINDHPWLARKIQAHGVHLGKQDLSPEEARKILGKGYILGGTANTIEDVRYLCRMGMDYIGAGPYRFTTTKKNLSPVLGLQGYASLLSGLQGGAEAAPPLIAIGGILPADVPRLLQAGVHGVAVSSAVNLAEEPEKAVDKFLTVLRQPTIEIE